MATGKFDPSALAPDALSEDILLQALDGLAAQVDEALRNLQLELARVIANHGSGSLPAIGVQAQIAEAVAKRGKVAAEISRLMAHVAAGDMPAAKPKAPRKRKQPGVLTQADLKLIDASAQIMGTAPEGEDMAFTHAVLCQVGLPRSKFEGREFMRQSGSAWVNVQAGWLDEGSGPVLQPLPYGPLPRLALAWISSQAVREKKREIAIGNSASEFLRMLGKTATGGRNGSFAALRKQMHALAACRLQFGLGVDGQGRTFNEQPVEQFDAWLQDKDRGQKSLWPGVMVLSEKYFKSLVEDKKAVPLDNRALLALSDSALALDVYAWLAHRLRRIGDKGVTLHWKALREQFGQEYKGKEPDKDFKDAFLPQLKKVLAVYPTAKVRPVKGGVLLLSSPPPVAYKE